MKRIFNKFKSKCKIAVCICLCLIGICSASCAGVKMDASDYKDAKNSVVVVAEYVALNGKEAEQLGRGSGFFIGKKGEKPQYLVTNHHVIAKYLLYGAGEYYTDQDGITYDLKSYIRIYYNSSDYEEAYMVAYNEIADVAVLKLDAPTDKRQALQLSSPKQDMVGSTVYAIGFPVIADNRSIDAISKWGLEDATFTSGVISRLTTTSGTGVKNIQMDADISAGNSGGPLVNEMGSVVGINRGEVPDSESSAASKYAVNIDEVISLLELHSVPYAMESKAGAGSRKLIIGSILAAAAVVAAAVILVFVRGRGRKTAAAQAQTPFPSTAPVSAVPSNSSEAVLNNGQAADSKDSGYRLQGVAGALEGRRFMVRLDSPLVIGRDPHVCNVVFPADTAGVSSRHCEVYVNRGTVYIKDNGSSHGTFFASGMKLSAGEPVRLMPGEVVWLGSEKETIVLTQKGGS